MARDLTEQMDQMTQAQQMEEMTFGVSDEITTEQEALAPVTPDEIPEPIEPVSLPDGTVQVASLGDLVKGATKFIGERVGEAEKRVTAAVPPKDIQTIGERIVIRQADQADIDALEGILDVKFDKGLNLPALMNASGDFDLGGYMLKVKELNKELFERARRGTLNYDALLQLAEEQGTDRVLQKWLTRQPGRGDAAEDVLAGLILARDLTRKTQDAFEMAGAATDQATRRQLFAEAAQYLTMEFALYSNLSGAVSESARMMYAMQQAQKIGVDLRRADELLGVLENEGINIEHLGSLYLSLPNNAAKTKLVKGIFDRGADVLTEVFINSILSNPGTHMVNVAGNAIFMGTKSLEEMVAGAIGASGINRIAIPGVRGKVNAKDRAYARDGLIQLETIGTSFIDALLVSGKAFVKEEASDLTSKIDVRNRRAIGNAGDITEIYSQLRNGNYAAGAINTVGTYIRMSGRFMLAEDEFFKAIGYRASIKKQARQRQFDYYDELVADGTEPAEAQRLAAVEYVRVLENPDQSAMATARDAAKELTFQGDLDGFAGEMQGFMSHPLVKIFGAAFFKTPVNVLNEVALRSPISLLYPSVRRDLMAGGKQADLAMARIATGSSMMAAFAYMGSGLHTPDNQVIIMGAGPTDPQARQAMERLGLMPHTINFKMDDGTYRGVTYSRLDPLSGLLAMAADYAYYAQYEDDNSVLENITVASGLGLYNYAMQQPFLQGVSDLTAILNNSDPRVGFEQAQKFFAERATTAALQVIPTVSSFGAGIERMQDPAASSTLLPGEGFFGEDPTQLGPMTRGFYTALQKAKARHPVFSADLPPSLNLWGEVRMQGSGAGWEMFSPIRIMDAKYEGLDRELMELGDGIAMPRRNISGVILNNEQYNSLIYAMNSPDPSQPTMKDALNDLIYNPLYNDLPTKEDKLDAIRAVYNKYASVGRKILMQQYPELRERVAAGQ